ncbi:MAG: alkaline phosphatase family protein [Planctomycetota bacterium]
MPLIDALVAALLAVSPPVVDAPRLLVVISVDQMRPDQLTRLAPLLDGGLGRMLREGLEFRAATLDYAATETGPGHTTLGTGCLPRTHGIVGNDMWLTDEQRTTYCLAQDGEARVTSMGVLEVGPDRGRGPAHMRAPALAERVRAAYPAAKVVSIAGKDRSAIGMTGRAGDAVLWWDRADGGFESTTAYCRALPAWAQAWNETWLELCSGWRWEPLRTTGLEALGTARDDRDGEAVFGPFGRGFPYQLLEVKDRADRGELGRLATLVYSSALVDECVARLARVAIAREGLGLDDVPDVLTLSFSATDTVGHANGPFSHEVTDVVLRLDRELGALFAQLDEQVGAGRWTAALSADHGVLPLPEHMVAGLVGARRVDTGELRATRDAIRAALSERYGERLEKKSDGEGFILDHARVAELGIDLAEARKVARDAAVGAIRAGSWLATAYTFDELAAPETEAGDPWRALFVNSFDAERSYDVVFRNAPWTLLGRGTGTSHGTCYPYDREVPLVFLGAGIPRGVRSDHAGSVDVVPTLLARIGVPCAAPVDGRDLLAGE